MIDTHHSSSEGSVKWAGLRRAEFQAENDDNPDQHLVPSVTIMTVQE